LEQALLKEKRNLGEQAKKKKDFNWLKHQATEIKVPKPKEDFSFSDVPF